MHFGKLFAGMLGTAMMLGTLQGMPPIRAADAETVFYVSPDGSDAGDGSAEAPFRTLEAARDAVRGAGGNVTVYLHGGTYRLTDPLTFTPEDSADADVLGGLANGTKVEVLQTMDGWSHIRLEGHEGYMREQDLKFLVEGMDV